MAVSTLTPRELQAWSRDGKEFLLLDVRDPDEIELARLPSAQNIPMDQVQARLKEIPNDRPVVVMCHLGGRSQRVAALLSAHGFSETYNLDGGIDAYAEHVDATIPRY